MIAPTGSPEGGSFTWAQAEPVGYLLREAYPSRWIRFHSLPGSKRYPTSPEEEHEVLRRHTTLLAELQGGNAGEPLVVIAVDWGWRDWGTGWSRVLLPESWPWRSQPISEEDPEEPDDWDNIHYFWVTSESSSERLAALLMAAASERAHFLLTDGGLDWLYCPYDGGADVLVTSATVREDLRTKYAAWRSARPDGL